MKWLALFAGAAVLALLVFLTRQPDKPQMADNTGPPRPDAIAPANPSPPATARPAAPVAAERPQALALRGVLYRGPGNDQSRALLSSGDAPATVFSLGQAVGEGWTLQSVAENHVMLAKGPAVARLDLSEQARPATAQAPASGSTGSSAEGPRMPGFVAGAPPPAAALTPERAAERNRAFLQARQQRAAGAASQPAR